MSQEFFMSFYYCRNNGSKRDGFEVHNPCPQPIIDYAGTHEEETKSRASFHVHVGMKQAYG